MSSIVSKDEERKVLNQIAMLLDSLGEDSYCGYAFAGCVEMADVEHPKDGQFGC